MQIIEAQPIKTNFKLAIVISRFNEEVTQALYQGAIQRLKELDFPEQYITVVWVPGAVEIPLTAQRLAKTDTFAAIICLGAVIRGDTSHYDYVCNMVSQGCAQVALQYGIPTIFQVLTTENEEQAMARAGGAHGNKGSDSIDAAFAMVSVLEQIY
jgi:6,7-dimethyl-8-ribityllumazine synthase